MFRLFNIYTNSLNHILTQPSIIQKVCLVDNQKLFLVNWIFIKSYYCHNFADKSIIKGGPH